MPENKEEKNSITFPKAPGPGVRTFREKDIPGILYLLNKYFSRGPESTDEIRKAILSELLLNNPWDEGQSPSLVYENKNGEIKGFLGIAYRKMRINGRPVTAAISYNYIVDPGSRSALVSFNLLKALLSGPQDISFTDSANDTSRRLWKPMGGMVVPLYSMYWKHPLRPAGFVAHHVEKQVNYKMPFKAITPVCKLTDQMISRFWNGSKGRDESKGYISVEITGEMLLQYIRQFSEGKSLAPVYTEENLNWLLSMAAKPKRFGELKKEAVFENDRNNMVGWFIYYKNPGGISEVLQVQAVPGKEKQVLTLLFQKARQQGAVGVAGRLDPEWVTILPDTAFCLYTPGRVWMLVHSDDQELIRAFKEGDAFFTRLEGDMWLI